MSDLEAFKLTFKYSPLHLHLVHPGPRGAVMELLQELGQLFPFPLGIDLHLSTTGQIAHISSESQISGLTVDEGTKEDSLD